MPGKRDFAHMIKLVYGDGAVILDYLGEPSIITNLIRGIKESQRLCRRHRMETEETRTNIMLLALRVKQRSQSKE